MNTTLEAHSGLAELLRSAEDEEGNLLFKRVEINSRPKDIPFDDFPIAFFSSVTTEYTRLGNWMFSARSEIALFIALPKDREEELPSVRNQVIRHILRSDLRYRPIRSISGYYEFARGQRRVEGLTLAVIDDSIDFQNI